MTSPSTHHAAIDGAPQPDPLARKATQSPPRDDLCCIFVHAGAGYHSIQNERIHLAACNDAAQVAMLILQTGGTAVEAVEMAVRMLEDREITNAGYGSNLAMDGVVECDASIVDHYGRSGAVGAVAQIKNPISLARLVLKHTMQPLTLRRVPPNLLVGQGAIEFADEQGMPVLPHDALVSPAARERWLRWREDLHIAERKAKKSGKPPSSYMIRKDPAPEDVYTQQRLRYEHEQQMLGSNKHLVRSIAPTSNPLLRVAKEEMNSSFRPAVPSPVNSPGSWPGEELSSTPESAYSSHCPGSVEVSPSTVAESSRNAFINSTQKVPTIAQLKDKRALRDVTREHIAEDAEMDGQDRVVPLRRSAPKSGHDGSEESDSISSAQTMRPPLAPISTTKETAADMLTEKTPTSRTNTSVGLINENAPLSQSADTLHARMPEDKEDMITDTVGAIAVDSWGNIACGASSGGIGMKYRGRVGPAALVGVGAAVVPIDPGDIDRTCVATVTSGTGEHMATTMAATVCAERLYQSVQKGQGGVYEEVSEDEALRAMIANEFMGHPSVRNSNSAGAIGILAVKKVRSGVMIYFGHNTDSFAMAHMHSNENKPTCVMSRSNGNGQIAQGGRMMRYQRQKKAKRSGPVP